MDNITILKLKLQAQRLGQVILYNEIKNSEIIRNSEKTQDIHE